MKAKNLIGIAVASTFGWSAAAFAGAGHEVITPFSPNESGEVVFKHQEGFGSKHLSGIGATSSHASGTVSGSMTAEGSTLFDSTGSTASLSGSSSMDESLALGDQGIYSDYYLVSLAPIDSWDFYVVDTDQLSAAEDVNLLTPSYDVVWVSGDMFSDSSMLILDSGD